MPSSVLIIYLGVASVALICCVLALASVWRLRLHAELGEVAKVVEMLRERIALLELQTMEPEVKIPSTRRVDSSSSTVRSDWQDRPRPTAPAGPTLITVPHLGAQSSESSGAELSSALGRRFGSLWVLAEAGASAESIARETGQPIGQVELILGLKRQLDGGLTQSGRSSHP